MPAFKLKDIVDLSVEHLAPKYGKNPDDIKKNIIGIRPGEKIHEEMEIVNGKS